MATGLNPGRLGTFDFYNRQSLDDYTLFPVRSQQLRGRAFWDRLANQGYRVGIFGYPVLVRPSFVIGGLAIDFCYGPEDLARQRVVDGGHGLGDPLAEIAPLVAIAQLDGVGLARQ